MIDEQAFERERPSLFAIAYRMLRSVSDAEDVCQEAWLRCADKDPSEVRDLPRYLSRVVARLCLDRMRSSKRRKEEYIGPWLPEPLPTAAPEDDVDPESISIAFMLLLETLSPTEQVVFLLRQVFEMDYVDVASVTGKTEAHCRQILRRARQHIAARRPRFPTDANRHAETMARFGSAIQSGDLEGLIEVLSADVRFTSDGGGKASAARIPIVGADAVAKFLVGIAKLASPEMIIEWGSVNHAPAVLSYEDGLATSVMVFDVEGGEIIAIYAMRNPEKMRHLHRG